MRLAAGLLNALLAASAVLPAGCEPRRITGDIQVSGVAEDDPLVRDIRRDPLAALQSGLDWYRGLPVRDYTCTVYKQERIDPKAPDFLPEQKLSFKFRGQPFSVYSDTLVNPRGGKEVLYVEGRWGNRMLVKPAGLGALFVKTLAVDPHGELARSNTLRFVDQFGFERSLESMIGSYRQARDEGALKIAVLGEAEVSGRSTLVLDVRVEEAAPSGHFEYPHVRICVDREWRLPLAATIWDAAGVERGRYRYADVQFNVGLTDADFDPSAYGMRPPKDE